MGTLILTRGLHQAARCCRDLYRESFNSLLHISTWLGKSQACYRTPGYSKPTPGFSARVSITPYLDERVCHSLYDNQQLRQTTRIPLSSAVAWLAAARPPVPRAETRMFAKLVLHAAAPSWFKRTVVHNHFEPLCCCCCNDSSPSTLLAAMNLSSQSARLAGRGVGRSSQSSVPASQASHTLGLDARHAQKVFSIGEVGGQLRQLRV